MEIVKIIAKELNWNVKGIANTIEMFDSGKTLPFIARYRKDQTMGLTDEQLFYFFNRIQQLRKLLSSKEKALAKLDELGILNDRLIDAIEASLTVSDVDDIMQPYKSTRKTRASKAREIGLQPMADIISGRINKNLDDSVIKNQGTKEEQIKMALDIIAEEVVTHPDVKKLAVDNLESNEMILTIDTSNEYVSKYENLNNINSIPRSLKPHQINSIFRAEKEKVLKVKFISNKDKLVNEIIFKSPDTPQQKYRSLYQEGVTDGVKRLLIPRAETTLRSKLKQKADDRAIEVFKTNLFNLLMEPPIKPQIILGIDPGYVSGCKVAVIEETGDFLDSATIYPTPPKTDFKASEQTVLSLCKGYEVNFIVIGNGTGSQETQEFVKNMIKKNNLNIKFSIIPETGASVYSASKIAREEFPDLKVEIRGAISIARRVLDPLAELVKIDPKSLGVGQYQHDVNQKELTEALDFVVRKAVNQNGVNLDTVSAKALSFIAGITPAIAKNIVKYREKEGIDSLNSLLKVSRLGEKVFEQASGFLRLPNSSNTLDNTMIHPQYYDLAKKMICDVRADLGKIKKMSKNEKSRLFQNLKIKEYTNHDIGSSTVEDIISELTMLGEDYRGTRNLIDYSSQPASIEDLKEGLILLGRVSNVADFGGFIDLGVKTNGLIHKSKMANRFVSNVHAILKVGDQVKVRVLEIDLSRKRISLELIEVNGKEP